MITRIHFRPLFFLVFILLTACGGSGEGDFGPKVVETTPKDQAKNVPVQGEINAVFSYPMDPPTVTNDTFYLTPGPVAGRVPGKVVYQNKTATFTPSIPLERGIKYSGNLTTGIKDLDGVPLGSSFVWTFETESGADTTPPTIKTRTPSAEAINVARNSPVLVTFSEPIDPESIHEKTFFIKGVVAEYTYKEDGPNGPTATLSPKEPLALDRIYQVTVTKGVTDEAGNGLADDVTWTFKTEKQSDTLAPTIIGKAPEGNDISVNTNITVTFDEEINAGKTPLNQYFIVEDLEGREAVSIHPPSYVNKVVTLDPVSDLRFDTQYRVTVKAGIEDFNGNKKATDTIWLFTTGKMTDLTAPSPVELFPGDGDEGISVQTDIIVTFSEAIDLRTLPTGSIDGAGESIPLDFIPAGGAQFESNTIRLHPERLLKSGATYQVRLSKESIRDLAGNQLADAVRWTFTTANAPVVENVSPVNGDVLNGPPSSITAVFSRRMKTDSINRNSFTLDLLNSQGQPVGAVPGTVRSEEFNNKTLAVFTPEAPLADALYQARLTTAVSDPDGNPLPSPFIWSFQVASAPRRPPAVTATSPARDEVVSRRLRQISVQFDQPIRPDSFEEMFQVEGGGRRFEADEVDQYLPQQNIAVFFLDADLLDYGVVYTATVKRGVRSQAGVEMDDDYQWTFSVEAAPDTTPPQVTATQPALDALNVPVNTTIEGVFNERIDPGSVGSGTFIVRKRSGEGNPVVPGRFEVTSERVSFIPSAPLDSGAIYDAVLKVGISDLHGNSLGSDFGWSFTTAP